MKLPLFLVTLLALLSLTIALAIDPDHDETAPDHEDPTMATEPNLTHRGMNPSLEDNIHDADLDTTSLPNSLEPRKCVGVSHPSPIYIPSILTNPPALPQRNQRLCLEMRGLLESSRCALSRVSAGE